MLKKSVFFFVILLLAGLTTCEKPIDLPDGLYASLTTTRGRIILRLEFEKVPMTVMNFTGLAEGSLAASTSKNKFYYNGSKFHRVIADFMIQAGEPADSDAGNPGYAFPDEFDPSLRHNRAGTLSMANSGPHTNGSQFFITHKETPWLDDFHTVFGYVAEGQSVVDAIRQDDKIKKVAILRIGEKAKQFAVSQARFDNLVKAANDKIAAEKKALEEAMKIDTSALPDGMYALMKTSRGAILLQLEFGKTPLTVANFAGLAEGSLKSSARNVDKYYDGLTFHRVIADFMIQGGCPQGTGQGNPGYSFPDEFDSSLKHDKAGILSMANSGPDTNGSQFFITHKETPWLDGKHTVFGHVVKGQSVVDAVQQGDIIESVEILRIGSKAENFIINQQVFDKWKAELLDFK